MLRLESNHKTFMVQVISIRDVIPPPQPEAFNDVYIASELMDTDLHHIIRSNQALSDEHCQVVLCLLRFFTVINHIQCS